MVEADLVDDNAEFLEKLYLEMVLRKSRTMIGTLALDALKVGMLVRGGMTLGELHHSDGVVLGPGLIEAYALESKVSKYPRTTISSSIYSRIHPNDRGANMRHDKDGIRHLDYFKNLNLAMHEDPALAKQVSELIDQNVVAHEQAQRWNEYAKWYWFRSELTSVRRENPNPQPESNVLPVPFGFEVKV